MQLPFAESWKIKMVEPIRKSTREQREQWIKEAHYNVFQLKANQVYIDLITDSGTGAMSDRQWAALMMGDESYAGAESFFRLKETISRLTGFKYVIPTHQGRAAENVLFSYLVHEGDIVPGNSHFDTTKGHIEGRKATALDCTIDEARQTQLEIPFKGNVDPAKLERALQENADRIPFIIVTITNNTAGGQPVSMENLRAVRAVADKYSKPVIFDSARFAENAYFIKTREEGYADKSIKEITREMFALADGMTMSAKKDGIVNMGGFIATNRQDWYDGAKGFCVQYEGYLTYGGMNGRDMEALAVGLDENTEFDNLRRIRHTLPAPGRRPRHLRGRAQGAHPRAQGGVPRADAHHRTVPGSRHTGLRDRLPAGRPRPRDAAEPLRRARPSAPGHTAPRIHRQPHRRGGSRAEERI